MLKMQTSHCSIDATQRRVVRTDQQAWQRSPSDGVLRKRLENEFAESGRTTGLVQFMPGASFSSHSHPMGEEILVLQGCFSDETGDYPAGTYLRNPPGSQHQPFSKEGCVLFVKLDYFKANDLQPVALETHFTPLHQGIGNLKVMSLHTFDTEGSALVFWPKGEHFQPHTHWGGEEIFVISGELIDEHGRYPQGTWIKSPHMSRHDPYVEHDTLIYVKTGHL